MLVDLIEKLIRRQDLTSREATEVMQEVMAGRTSEAQLGAFLSTLVMKGERPEEIVGFAKAMRKNSVKLSGNIGETFDTCGTGGDRSGTFNISSAVAVVIASCGLRVAKHGNRSVSSQCGSADVFEALGVNISASPGVVSRSLSEAGIGFLFAQNFHPAMKHAAQTRRDLGFRTAFNLLGPLTNPAGSTRQLVGVSRPELTELMANALRLLGSTRAWVVHGSDGLDEISTIGYTKIAEYKNGSVQTFYIHPSEFGIPQSMPGDCSGGDAKVNAEIILRLLQGKKGPARNVVLLNAGAALLVAGASKSVREGIERAEQAIDSGKAHSTLKQMIQISHEAELK